jgi:hypothetical protein
MGFRFELRSQFYIRNSGAYCGCELWIHRCILTCTIRSFSCTQTYIQIQKERSYDLAKRSYPGKTGEHKLGLTDEQFQPICEMTENPRPFNLTDNKSACVKHCKKVLTHISQTGNIIRNDRYSCRSPFATCCEKFSEIQRTQGSTTGVLALLSVVPSRSNLIFAVQIERWQNSSKSKTPRRIDRLSEISARKKIAR